MRHILETWRYSFAILVYFQMILQDIWFGMRDFGSQESWYRIKYPWLGITQPISFIPLFFPFSRMKKKTSYLWNFT